MSKKNAKRKPIEVRDFGTREIHQRQLVVIEGDGQPHAKVVDQWPLDRYWLRGELEAPRDVTAEERDERRALRLQGLLTADGDGMNGRLYLAGMRLKADWEASEGRQCVTMRLDRVDGGRGSVGSREEAREAKNRALADVGLLLTPVLVHVACCGGSAQEWALGRGEDRRFGLPALRLALAALAQHYRL